MNSSVEEVFNLWEIWELETDRRVKSESRVRLFTAIERTVTALKLQGGTGLPMTPREFLHSARGHYANWRKRAH